MESKLRKNNKYARPYAHAIFALAMQYGQLDIWRESLALAGQVIVLGKQRQLFVNPWITNAEKLSFFTEISHSFPAIAGLLQLLVERKQLILLPVIAAIYDQLILVQRQILQVKVIAAYALTEHECECLVAALTKRYQHKIMLDCSINQTLLGGAVIYVQDQKFDSSLIGVLQRLHKVCGSK